MPLVVRDWIPRLGMLVEPFGQHHDGAEIDLVAPPPAQDLAPELDVLDVLRVRGRLDRRQFLRQADPDDAVGIDAHLLRRAHEIARRHVPALTLPLVHVRLDPVAVGAPERRVDVEHRLHEVLARWDLRRALERVPARRSVDDNRLVRLQAVDVDAEDLLRARAAGDLKPRLGLAALRDDEQDAAVERTGIESRGIGDLESNGGGAGAGAGGQQGGQRDGGEQTRRQR